MIGVYAKKTEIVGRYQWVDILHQLAAPLLAWE
jgi:hypothetical protein